MNKKILIDAAFREETRVAVISDGVLEDYDREDFNFKQLKGNILIRILILASKIEFKLLNYNQSKIRMKNLNENRKK